MTGVLGTAVQLLVAAVLLLAGAQKVAVPAKFTDTLRKLRLPAAVVLRTAVPVVELATAAVVAVGTFRWLAAGLVAVQGIGFGAAGLVALQRRAPIACACFGPLDSGVLGARQVFMVPVWLLAAAALAYLPGVQGLAGIGTLTALALGMGAVAAAYLMVPWIRDRRSARVVTPQ